MCPKFFKDFLNFPSPKELQTLLCPAKLEALPIRENPRAQGEKKIRTPLEKRTRPPLLAKLTGFPRLLGSTNPCPIAVDMEPFSTSVFKRSITLEYLLLPPRSALKVAPPLVTHLGFYTAFTQPSYSSKFYTEEERGHPSLF